MTWTEDIPLGDAGCSLSIDDARFHEIRDETGGNVRLTGSELHSLYIALTNKFAQVGSDA